MDLGGTLWIMGAVIVLLGVMVVYASCFTVHTKQAAIVERFGTSRIAGPGLNFKTPRMPW